MKKINSTLVSGVNRMWLLFAFILICNQAFAQLVSSEIEYNKYEDDKNTEWLQSSGRYEFIAEIIWDYEEEKLVITNMFDGEVWFSATWTEEVHPDELPQGQLGKFIFDPKKNDMGVCVLNIFQDEESGEMYYSFVAPKTIIFLFGVEEEYLIEDIEVTEGDYNGTSGDKTYYLNLSNATDYTIYVATYYMNTDGEWILSEQWATIEPGTSTHVGMTHEDDFYYYAWCVDSKNEYIIWEGTDYYAPVNNSDGNYGFRKINVYENGLLGEDGEEWYMELTEN
ncbi:MAG: hypothetical protein IPM74_08285 [Crocinitomicaceae bacterium]|nr:hypothetical protein [Crocinitomicaceae bacterium]MBK8925895.1 hypothetical protein [Crocinitomicaceae bacterium]